MSKPPEISNPDRRSVVRALRGPRGFYDARRASQLSGVPQSTIGYWAKKEILTPDWNGLRPRGWSYRDLLYIRLLAWLRKQGMGLSGASARVRLIRQVLAGHDIDPSIRSDGQHAFLGDESFDRFSGQQTFEGLTRFLTIFDIAQPVHKVSRFPMWGPGLVYPSKHTHISPWVLAGEPCVSRTRIPTTALFALREDRLLPSEGILVLYPQLTVEAIRDAINLEKTLRSKTPHPDAPAA